MTLVKLSKSNFSIQLLTLLIIGSFFTFHSCSNRAEPNFERYNTGIDFDLHTIEVFNDILYTTGGDVWSLSQLSKSSDGINWKVDSLSNKSIFDLLITENNIYGVGVDGYIFSGNPIEFHRTKYWGILHAIEQSSNGFVAVGGKNWNKGYIYTLNRELTIDTTFTYDHELSSVAMAPDGTLTAVGYGIILTSTDDGYSWSREEVDGDFYNSIAYNSEGVGYIIGNSGNILISYNNGKTWDTKKSGYSLWNKKTMRKIVFDDSLQGVIVGKKGLILKTLDGGKTWENISISTINNFYDATIFKNQIIIASNAGIVYKINL
ncbi:MAG: YCF48-related protein [Saprospiraceae bacterium]